MSDTGFMPTMSENTLYMIGGGGAVAWLLYEYLNYMNVYGSSDKIYMWFGGSVFLLLFTYTLWAVNCSRSTPGQCRTPNTVLILLIIMVASFLTTAIKYTKTY